MSETDRGNQINIVHLYDEEAPSYDGDYFDALTLGGDRVFSYYFQETLNKFRRERMQRGNTNPITLLDMGCGTGIVPGGVGTAGHVPPFFSIADHSIQYVGFDLSMGMLKQASTKIPEAAFIQADMHKMPFGDSTFDMVVSGYGPFSYSLEPEILADELVRVLRPGGKLFIMPYTARLGSGIATGFSTAHLDNVEKLFYTKELAEKILERDFENIDAVGINYAGHFIQQAANLIRFSAQPAFVLKQVRAMMNFARTIAIEPRNYSLEELNRMLTLWRKANLMKNSESPYDGPGYNYLLHESRIAQVLKIEPGLARHMIITAELKK